MVSFARNREVARAVGPFKRLALALLVSGCASAPATLTEVLDAPVWTVEKRFGSGAPERCYESSTGRFLKLSVDPEDASRFWRVILSDVLLCEQRSIPQPMPDRFELAFDLGEPKERVLAALGEPESKDPQPLAKLGGEVWSYECTESPACGWLTRVFFRESRVSAIEISYYP